MTSDTRTVKLYSSDAFKAEVGKYMSEQEEEAFGQHLVRNPLLGEPMPEVPGCLIVAWMNGQVHIRYTLSDDHTKILLISISPERELEFSREDKDKVHDIMDTLKKAGIGALLRELFDAIRDWLG